MTVRLCPLSEAAAAAILAGRNPPGLQVAHDYPTEFSHGIAGQAASGSPLGPFFIQRTEDDVVVGEIGGGFVAPGVVEIGYAITPSCQGHGHATAAVRALLALAGGRPGIEQIRAHTPLDRPASARVLEKAGFTADGEVDDEHDGVRLRVRAYVRRVRS
jgi:RimJ/RimL family protein N-acetyltransferase